MVREGKKPLQTQQHPERDEKRKRGDNQKELLITDEKSKMIQYEGKKPKLQHLEVIEMKPCSPTLQSENNSSNQEVPNLTKFKQWTIEQTCSVLSTPVESGGVGLSFEDVKPLYDAGFKGISLSNIVDDIMKEQNAVDECLKDFPNVKCDVIKYIINSDTIKCLVNWVENTKLIGFTDLWLENEIKKKANPETIHDESLKHYLKIYNVRNDFLILAEHEIQSRIISDIQSITKQHNFTTISITLKIHEKFNTALPIMFNNDSTVLAKHHLPYIPKLHIKSKLDDVLLTTPYKSVSLIAPSGMGKTGLMIRTMSKYPGIFLTGSARDEMESNQTSDSAVKFLVGLFRSRFEAFCFIRQAVVLLLISKLLHVLNMIEKYCKDKSIAKDFDDNLFSFLAFNQSNGNTKTEKELFNTLFCTLKFAPIDELRKYASTLIEEIKIKTESKKFVICLDEAHVLEEHSTFKFLSCNGTLRGVLTVFVSEITKLNENGLNIYAGTSFSVDISNVVESPMACLNIFEFEYLNTNELNTYLYRHVKYTPFKESRTKLRRIRQAALAIELYVADILSELRLLDIPGYLMASSIMMEDNLTEAVRLFIQSHSDLKDLFADSLFDYVLHYEHPDLMGSSFQVSNKLASHLVRSGLTCPVGSTVNQKKVEFRAVDELGNLLSKKLIELSFQKFSKMDLAIHIINNAHCRKQIEKGICVGLCALNGKQLLSLMDVNTTINPTLLTKLQGVRFECDKVLTPTTYIEYCQTMDG